MRSKPEDEYDHKELKKMRAEAWMMELLDLNPEYVYWGPHEDYMAKSNSGWESPLLVETWKEFGWNLDDLNECVNFYFEIVRAKKPCAACGMTGCNSETRQISDDFYDFANTGRRWADNITEDELKALQDRGRLSTYDTKEQRWIPLPVTVEQVNAANRRGGQRSLGWDHDTINRGILIKARADRLGVYGLCTSCEGDGFCYTEPSAHVKLVLWMIHPRKGASRGVEIQLIDQDDLPNVFAWLKEAAKRNAERFAKVVVMIKDPKKPAEAVGE
jgi:hypothetical protein